MVLTRNQLIGASVGGILLVAAVVVLILYLVGIFDSDVGASTTITPKPEISKIKFIPNTYILHPNDRWEFFSANGDKTDSGEDSQTKLNDLFESQKNNDFGQERIGILLMPGSYDLTIQLGFYTTLAGLGFQPGDVIVNGTIQVPNNPSSGALDNFYRGFSNLTLNVSSSKNFFAISQATFVRDCIINGNFAVAESPGFSSGGFISDTTITGELDFQTQQQFFIRNCEMGSIKSGNNNWNLVFVGSTASNLVSSNCSLNLFSVQSIPTISDVHIRRIPRVVFTDNLYQVLVPPTEFINNGQLPKIETDLVPVEDVLVLSPETFSVSEANLHLDAGHSLLFSPGVYTLTEPLLVTKSNTVILGLGFATLQPVNGTAAIVVTDQSSGTSISSLLLDAGNIISSTLLNFGEIPRAGGNIANPSFLQDVFGRVGGPNLTATASTMVTLNQNFITTDNAWNWRADHGLDAQGNLVSGGVGPTNCVCQFGLQVNGDNVTALGLFSEHCLTKNVTWAGDNGKCYFLQSELAYDVPSSYVNPTLEVTGENFFGTGLGAYSFFVRKWSTSPGPQVPTGFVVPSSGVINSCFTVFLSTAGWGEISTVVNDKGPASSSALPDTPFWCGFQSEQFCADC